MAVANIIKKYVRGLISYKLRFNVKNYGPFLRQLGWSMYGIIYVHANLTSSNFRDLNMPASNIQSSK